MVLEAPTGEPERRAEQARTTAHALPRYPSSGSYSPTDVGACL